MRWRGQGSAPLLMCRNEDAEVSPRRPLLRQQPRLRRVVAAVVVVKPLRRHRPLRRLLLQPRLLEREAVLLQVLLW